MVYNNMQISNLITKIENNVFSEKELINLFNNAISNNKISEEDKALLIFSIEKNTRLRFPKSAKRIFGAKESFAESKLDKLYQDLCKEFNLSNNQLKNGVKTGGLMISGEFYIDVYMSYKNIENHGVAITLTQPDIESELTVTVKRYKTYGSDSGTINMHESNMDDFDNSAQVYKAYIQELIQ